MKKRGKRAVVEDYLIWIIIGLIVLTVGVIAAYLAFKKGMINLDSIKNIFG